MESILNFKGTIAMGDGQWLRLEPAEESALVKDAERRAKLAAGKDPDEEDDIVLSLSDDDRNALVKDAVRRKKAMQAFHDSTPAMFASGLSGGSLLPTV